VKQKLFFQLLSVLFVTKAAFGVLYIFFGWKATIAGWVMPLWLIVVAIVVDSYLAYLAYNFSKGKK